MRLGARESGVEPAFRRTADDREFVPEDLGDPVWPLEDEPELAPALSVPETPSACGTCPHCLTINFSDAGTCRECHQPMSGAAAEAPEADEPPEPPVWPEAPVLTLQACPRCGAQDDASANYCRACGAALRPGERRRIVLPAVRFDRPLVLRAAMGLAMALGLASTQLLPSRAAHRVPAPPVAAAPRAPPLEPAAIAAVAPAPVARPRLIKAEAPKPAPPHRAARKTAPSGPAPAHSDPSPATRIYNVVWTSRPSAEEVIRQYPARARAAGISQGAASIDCVVASNGGLNRCAVVSEAPARLGFGQAALRLASRFRAGPNSAAGWPVAGYRVRVPVEWRLE
jgi:TonB family protein